MRQLLRTAIVFTLIIAITALIILYGRGYRFDVRQKSVAVTGSLVATSDPNGAQVLVDGKFVTATNSTVQLPPGEYNVRIVKEGYIPWEKGIEIMREVVSKADVTLFPTNPSLSPLTSSGVENPVISPDGTRIVFVRKTSASLPNEQSPEGLWLLELTSRTFGFSRELRQIARKNDTADWAKTELVWSPDSKQILALFSKSDTQITDEEDLTASIVQAYLLDADRLNQTLRNVTFDLDNLLKQWQEQWQLLNRQQLSLLPAEIAHIATDSIRLIAISPDESKLLYQATASASLPLAIKPPLLGTNPTTESREIEPGKLYVYDIKEDKNFFIMEKEIDVATSLSKSICHLSFVICHSSILGFTQWYPTSRHLILPEEDHITVMEYDGTNRIIVYASPFADNFAIPWPSGGRIVLLITLNPAVSSIPNLYLLNLR